MKKPIQLSAMLLAAVEYRQMQRIERRPRRKPFMLLFAKIVDCFPVSSHDPNRHSNRVNLKVQNNTLGLGRPIA
ncbi:MAG: hypothetical protein ACYDC8_16455 [Gammaproteobacteria bacterium]